MANYIGIDLGTTESTVSIIEITSLGDEASDKLKTVSIYQFDEHHHFDRDNKTLQSAIYIDRDNKKIYTGAYAKALYASGNKPLNTIRSIKTRIGGESMIQAILDSDKDDLQSYDMTELSAVLLKSIKNSLEKQLETKNMDVVTITIPAGFNSDERNATIESAYLAGFKNVQLLDEPTAVLLNFLNSEEIIDNAVDEDFFYEKRKVLVYDIGGGTLDISIANVENIDGAFSVDIIGRSKRMDFGGDDIDKYIASYFLEDFEKINDSIEKRTLEEQSIIISRIVSHAEKSKISFDNKITAILDNKRRRERFKESVNFEIIDNLKVTDITLSDKILKNILSPVINKNGALLLPLTRTLKEIKIDKSDIDLVILTGGSGKFYLVEETLNSFFNSRNGEEEIPLISFCTSDAVSKGAVIHSHNRDNEDFKKIQIDDIMSDSIFLKRGYKFDKIIAHTTTLGTHGKYSYAFEHASNRLELFLYYGIDGEESYKYKEITGVFKTLDRWYKRGESVEIEWELDDNKIVHIYFNRDELLTTHKNINKKYELLETFKINEL